MNTNDMTAGERAARYALLLLRELVSDAPGINIERATQVFQDACKEARVDARVLLTKASRDLCAVQPGFEERLRDRAAAVESIAVH